jgi:hypothetical protein
MDQERFLGSKFVTVDAGWQQIKRQKDMLGLFEMFYC